MSLLSNVILIAHRGNWKGPSEKENDPEYLEQALKHGFDVETDIWYIWRS